MIRRALAVLLVCVTAHTLTLSQDYRKVIELAQRVEQRLNAMIVQELRARRAADNDARADLGKPQLPELPEVTPASPSAPAAGHETHAAPARTSAPASGHETHAAPVNKDPLSRLEEGNRRFVEGHTASRDFLHERPMLTGGQHPFAIVLTCSDSRVPPELLFDESLGQIFVIRDAGNVVDSVVLGSIEYAAEHLHVGLLVVLGHEACGAVNATIKGGDVPPNIGSIVRRLSAPVEKIKAQNLTGVRLDSVCIHENVNYQVAQVTAQSALLTSMVEEGHLRIVGGVYSLTTGAVTFLKGSEPARHAGHVPGAGPTTAVGGKSGH